MTNRAIPFLLAVACLAPTTFAQGWTSAVDPATDVKGKPRLDLRLTVPIKHKIETAVPTRPSPFIAVCDANPFVPRTWSLLNLHTGGLTPALNEKMNLDEPTLSPDGQYLAGKARGERGGAAALEVWSLKAKKGLHRLSSGDQNWPPVPLGFAADDRLLSTTNVQHKPKLQAWDLKTGKQAWEIDLPKQVTPAHAAVSPGGKFLAVIVENRLIVCETSKGATHAEQQLPESEERAPFGSQPKGVAFSSDGTQIAAYCEHGHGKGRLVVWDTATGSVVADKLGEMLKDDRWARGAERKFEFFEGGRLLRFGNHVLDRETGQSVYTIPPSKQGRGDELYKTLGEDRVLIVSEKEQDRAHVTVATLPKAEIEKSVTVVKSGGKSSDAALPPLTKPDYTAVRTVLETAPAGGWTLKPDAPATKLAGATAPVPVRPARSPGGDEFAAKRVIFSGPPANQVAVAYHVTSKGAKRTVVERLSVAGGAAAGSFEFPEHADLLDFAADGKSLLIRHGEDRVDLYSIAAAGPAKPVVGFRPYEGDKQSATVKAAGILSAEQFFTVSQWGRLVMWTVGAQGAKAVYELAAKGDDFELSPNRKHLAFANGEGVTILDPAAGQVLAMIPGAKTWNDQLAFHPDGSRLVHFASHPYTHLKCYDLTTGKLISELATPKETWVGPVVWSGTGHVLINGYLADLDKRLVVWRYERDGLAPKQTRQPDDRYWAFARADFQGPGALIPAQLPHAEAQKLIASIKPDNFAVRPGTKVSVEVSVAGDEPHQKKVADALVRAATAAGLVVAEGQKTVLTAATTHKEGIEKKFNIIGGNPAVQTVTIPTYECKVTMTQDGQSLWEAVTAAGGMIPVFPRLQEGQTVQELVDKANANPGQSFYTTLAVPGTIARPLETVGASRVTLKGVIPVNQ
jgi:WD40 repeat protein